MAISVRSQGTGCPIPADAGLEAQGWRRRSRATPAQVSELKAQYEELGFDVLVRASTREEFEDQCGSCGDAAACPLVLIYTRAQSSPRRNWRIT